MVGGLTRKTISARGLDITNRAHPGLNEKDSIRYCSLVLLYLSLVPKASLPSAPWIKREGAGERETWERGTSLCGPCCVSYPIFFARVKVVLYNKRYTDPHGEERKGNTTAVKLKQVQYIAPYCTCFNFTALYFLSSLCRGDQLTVFCIVSFDFN